MSELPSGTVTFLFTDVEGSTRLWEKHPEEMKSALGRHDELVRQAIESHSGYVFTTAGDAFAAAFQDADEAVTAAVDIQLAIAAEDWDKTPLRVRAALHTGEADERDGDYFGPSLNRVARLMSVAHGGQVVLSGATWELVDGDPPVGGAGFNDLGEHRLKDLGRVEHVYQLTHPDLPAEFPPLLSMDAHPNNLPVQLTSFVGREEELADALDLLGKTRLLTLTGPGGTGKTRMAIQVAAEAAESFKHGVFFVPLGAISDPELVPSAIATTLALTQLSGPPLDHLEQYLSDKELLLVLDNFEQVLPAAAQVADLLRVVPDLKTVVTSRAPLHVSGEQEFPVPPLSVPGPEAAPGMSIAQEAAVALFVERAAAARPDFRLTPENATAVGAITVQLDGLPLAIELAAVRVRMLSPEAIASKLEGRLDLLSGGARDLPARQQTLRDTIAWSYDLLSDSGRRLLHRLAVFRGGVALPQALHVCGPSDELGMDLLDGIEILIDQSLLQASVADEPSRLTMLETIREFAQERLDESGESDQMHRRHSVAYLNLAEEAEPHLLYRNQARWLGQLEDEHDNFRAVLGWAQESQETDTALKLCYALWRFWQIRGHLHEAGERLAVALALPGGQDRNRAKALEAAGGVAYWRGDMESALDLYQQSLDLMVELGDDADIANALCNLGYPYAYKSESDLEKAERLFTESLTIAREQGDQLGIAKAIYGQGGVPWIAGDWSRARSLFDESRQLFDSLDEPYLGAWALYMLGNVEVSDGRPEAARPLLEEGIQLFAEVGDITGILFHLDLFTTLALQDGQSERAVRLIGASTRLRETSGAALSELSRRDIPGLEETLHALGDDQVQMMLAEGEEMNLDEVVADALGRKSDSKATREEP